MPESLTAGIAAAILAGSAIGLGARILLFLGSCSLANAGNPSLGKALLLVLLALAVCTPACWWLYFYCQRQIPTTDDALIGPALIAWTGLSSLVAWILPTIIYKIFLPTPWKKAILVAGLEVVLGALMAGLVIGVLLVILAGVQVVRHPSPTSAAPATFRLS